MSGRLFIIDDDPAMRDMLTCELEARGHSVCAFPMAEDAFENMKVSLPDVVLADVNMPRMSGIELCDRIVSNWPDVPVVLITAFGSLDTAVEALRAGAYDFVTKPIELDVLEASLRRALQHHALSARVASLGEELARTRPVSGMFGSCPAMAAVFDQVSRVASSDISVLVTGESGTGKELVARALHEQNPRRGGPFVAINCAALPEALLESELFGHAQGAFTGARAAHTGLFAQADGGTLFLDEVGELPLPLQAKLLRALESHTVRPVGADREVPFDARLVSATNQDLESAVEQGRMRDDLFYRLEVMQIHLPPLRSRGHDVLLMAESFIGEFCGGKTPSDANLSPEVARRLLDYSWPGNVRELRNAMERAVTLCGDRRLTVEDLPPRIRRYRPRDFIVGGEDPREFASLELMERRYIEHVMKVVGQNRTLASRILGVDRKTLYRKLQRYGTPGPTAAE